MEEEQQQQSREDPSSKSGVDEEEKLGGNEENGGDWTTSILLLGLWGVLMFYVFNLTPNQTQVSSRCSTLCGNNNGQWAMSLNNLWIFNVKIVSLSLG